VSEQEERAPKPYTLVEWPQGAVARAKPTGHRSIDLGKRTGRLELTIEALTPVHVASGVIKLTNDEHRLLARDVVRVGGKPVLPGSSVKGCIRSIAEAISHSCVRLRRDDLPDDLSPCTRKNELCMACQIFGSFGYLAPVRFGDFHQTSGDVALVGVPLFHQPGKEPRLYRDGRWARGRKFYMHSAHQARGDSAMYVCTADSRFEGTIEFANLDDRQLGLLLVALGLDTAHPFKPKLGGAKPACYGTIAIEVRSFTITNVRNRYTSWNAAADEAGDAQLFIDAAHPILSMPQLDVLAQALRWPNGDYSCPDGIY
jgi:CRISPR/Cas system CSM-associated protein Csm3 (group 7 of RAMP superfamily)